MRASLRPLVLASLAAAVASALLGAIPRPQTASAPLTRERPRSAECADARALVARVRGVSAGITSDLRARLVNTAPGSPRTVVELRIRAKSTGAGGSVLVEAAGSLPRARALFVNEGGRVTAYSSPPPGPSRPGRSGHDVDETIDWLSPCMRAEDFVDAQYWWPAQRLQREERVDEQDVCVVRSEPGDRTATAYEYVTSWIDPIRLVPLRTEKARRAGAVLRFTYNGIRRHEGIFVARRVDAELVPGGCRSELTILGGTSNAHFDDALFDPSRFAITGRNVR